MKKYLKLIFTSALLCFYGSAAFAENKTMSNLDQSELLKAIEDYRFNDFDASIPSLTALHNKYPSNLKVTRYLALSYMDDLQFGNASKMYKTWLNQSNVTAPQTQRFAWLGLANAELQLKNYAASRHALEQWLAIQPDDVQSRILLGDVQVRNKDYNDAKNTWEKVLASAQATDTQKAAAWYYKAWIAYLQGNMSSTKMFAKTSITLDHQGSYASAAEKLLTAEPLKKIGFTADASLGLFYNSNVELLPDILKSTGGGDDSGLQAGVQLNWALQDGSISYILNSTKHQSRNEFDITLHLLSTAWSFNDWQLTPSFEYITLNNEFLYQGLGLGFYYNQGSWAYHYAIKAKTYNDTFGDISVDLSRLGGTSHNVGLSKNVDFQNAQAVFTADITSEQTKGDATHDKTDDFIQVAVGTQLIYPLLQDLTLHANFNLFNRNYAAADTTILLDATSDKARSDLYVIVATSTAWRPLADKDSAFIFDVSYQKNNSNYDTSTVSDISIKSYSAWKVGSSFSKQW